MEASQPVVLSIISYWNRREEAVTVRTEILHELPPPMLIDIALVVAAAADDAVPVVAMSIVVEVPISMCDMSMFAKEVFQDGEEAGMVQDWEACGQE